MNIKTLTVTEVSNYIKRVIDNDFILGNLSVKGEISNLKFHSSGHIYFSLKDESSKINCVMFKSKAMYLDVALEEGMQIVVKGRASIYPATGSMQIYCEEINKEGIGELFIKFEKLKKKLESKGYFETYNKKELPKYPRRIGVVTSPTGAAIRDIINVIKRRNGMVDIVLYPAKVQGIDAYKEIIEGIQYFNERNNVDLLIVGRGGGSIEELWNFNEEALAEAIYNSNIPIISAVGHEVDFTICDFVSDIRAATPSQGAEIAVPLENDIKQEIERISLYLDDTIYNKIKNCRNEIISMEKILKIHSPLSKIQNYYLEVDKIKDRLDFVLKTKLNKEKQRLESLNSLLIAHNPVNILSRGYAIIEDNDTLIKSKEQLREEKNLMITFKDGKIKGKFMPSDKQFGNMSTEKKK